MVPADEGTGEKIGSQVYIVNEVWQAYYQTFFVFSSRETGKKPLTALHFQATNAIKNHFVTAL